MPFVNAAPLDDAGRCGLCRRGLQGFDAVFCYGEYEGPLRGLIHLLKFGGVRPLGSVLGRLLLQALPREQRFDAVVPMPLHWFRLWRRGFNQSLLLARFVSKRLQVPVINGARRRRSTAPQSGLTNAERRANVTGAFAVRRRDRVAGKHILLVDDVLTTGATASACAAALKRAGARRVTVAAVARVDRRRTGFASSVLLSDLATTGVAR
ncbi:MAG: ComF family protein [Acidobacteria bacterium]|nr:ComF family protein [Acidobacteriota bacterium]